MADTQNIHIIGGGTNFYLRPHLALSAPARGSTAKTLAGRLKEAEGYRTMLHLTKMAGGSSLLDTNADMAALIDHICEDPSSRAIFLTAALCDFEAYTVVSDRGVIAPTGLDQPRLKTAEGSVHTTLIPAPKIINRIRSRAARKPRKDIFLVACKTTTGAHDDEMFLAGLRLLKNSSCNLVLVNDIQRRRNMIVTPEQARYAVTDDREKVLSELAEMALLRMDNTFERTIVERGDLIPLTDPQVPETFKRVVQGCIDRKAYKDLLHNGKTVGHFAWASAPGEMMSSRRHQNFNAAGGSDLVRVETGNQLRAFGAKPSAGARSQAELFEMHPSYDCVVHFHCPMKDPEESMARLIRTKQRPYECGSFECGLNTSGSICDITLGPRHGHNEEGLPVGVVMLDKHGPNILFHSKDDPDRILAFIDRHWDLSRHTGDQE